MKPGIYHGTSNAEYHGAPGISKSGLDLINRCPAWYKHCKETPREETAAFTFGSATHAAILEPQVYATDFAVAPECDRRTNAGKALWAGFFADNAGKTIITRQQADDIEGMQASVGAHPAASKLLSAIGLVESSVFWNDEATGMLCKCRPDFWRNDGIVVDVKTTEDASPEAFMRSCYNYRYHVQAAFYMDGIEAATGERPKAFIFLAIEKKAPYLVGCYMADTDMIRLGEIDYRRDIEKYTECMCTGKWGGYGDTIQTIGLPAWALNNLKE